MKKIATTLVISSLVLGGFIVSNSNADDDRYERRGHSGKHCNKKFGKGSADRFERMKKRLNLSDEQAKQVRAIRDSYSPKRTELAKKTKQNRQQLREAMRADTINQDKVKELAQTMGDLKTDKIILRAKMRTEIHKVLSKEQREKMKNRKGYRGHSHGHRHHG